MVLIVEGIYIWGPIDVVSAGTGEMKKTLWICLCRSFLMMDMVR